MRLLPALLPLLGAIACQGDFERPAFDNPNDPANGNLPPTPEIQVYPRCDGASGPFSMAIEIDISSEVGVAEFQLFRSTSAAVDPGELILRVPRGTTRIVDDTGISQGTTYFYAVRAVGTSGLIGLRSSRVSARGGCP